MAADAKPREGRDGARSEAPGRLPLARLAQIEDVGDAEPRQRLGLGLVERRPAAQQAQPEVVDDEAVGRVGRRARSAAQEREHPS